MAQKRLGAPQDISRAMHLKPGEMLLRYRALVTANDRPYCVEVGYLARQGAGWLDGEMLERAEPVEWLRERLDRLSGRVAIHATRLTTECAETLGVENGLPVLTLDRTLWCDGLALSHSRRVYPPGHKVGLAK